MPPPAMPNAVIEQLALCQRLPGVAISRNVSPRCPICLAGFMLRLRSLFVLRTSPSPESGSPVFWLALASCASSSCYRAAGQQSTPTGEHSHL
jgi:hypothetical protein